MASIKILEFRDEKSLLKSIGANHTVVALDEKGHDFTSQQFAKDIIEKNQIYGRAPLDFVVGPADGHSESLRQRANHQICFGRMTLGHRMIRLVLLEQIYRAYKIIRGEPYHRG